MADDKKQLPIWLESIILVATALVLAVFVKTFLFQAFYIPSASMEPTLLPDDKLLVQKVSYWTGEPQRGDIVVFDDPGGWLGSQAQKGPQNLLQRGLELTGLYPSGGHLIKRVVGVGGDEVSCCDAQGRTTVNGEPIDEPYLDSQAANEVMRFTVEVPAGYLWLQGDNRGNSSDSRAHLGRPGGGFISEDRVVGKAWIRVWPSDRMGRIEGTEAFASLP